MENIKQYRNKTKRSSEREYSSELHYSPLIVYSVACAKHKRQAEAQLSRQDA